MKRALTLAILASLLVVPGATAHIVVHKCIAGVSLYDTPADVKRALGLPAKRVPNGDVTEWRYAGLTVGIITGVRLSPTKVVDVVVYVATTRGSERTAGGIGVGSTEASLRTAFPKLRCSGLPRTCEIGRAPITSFSMKGGKVARILIDATSAFDDAPFPKRDPRC